MARKRSQKRKRARRAGERPPRRIRAVWQPVHCLFCGVFIESITGDYEMVAGVCGKCCGPGGEFA